jgi:hypothetical protein
VVHDDLVDEDMPGIVETAVKMALATVPVVGGPAVVLFDAVRTRVLARLTSTATDVSNMVGPDRLASRLAESAEFESLFVNGLEAAARTGYEAKRRLLARVIGNAANDEAQVDPSGIIASVLRDLDAPHIRALEWIRAAEDAVSDELPNDEAERLKHEAAHEAAQAEDGPVVIALANVGTLVQDVAYGGPVVPGRITPFGRQLLQDLRAANGGELDTSRP